MKGISCTPQIIPPTVPTQSLFSPITKSKNITVIGNIINPLKYHILPQYFSSGSLHFHRPEKHQAKQCHHGCFFPHINDHAFPEPLTRKRLNAVHQCHQHRHSNQQNIHFPHCLHLSGNTCISRIFADTGTKFTDIGGPYRFK